MNSPASIEEREKRAFRNWMMIIVGGLLLVVVVNFFVWFLATRNQPNLVTDQPYEEGLAYQDVVESLSRSSQAGYTFSVREDLVVLKEQGERIPLFEGRMEWKRPDDPTQDQIFRLEEGAEFPTTELKRGLWRVEYSFTKNGQTFRIKRAVQLP